MSDTGKQSPLGVNVLSGLLQNNGVQINPVAVSYMGSSTSLASYSFGSICQDTCLRLLTYSINDAYARSVVNEATYNNLISIGGATSSIAVTSITSDENTITVTHSTSVISQFPAGTYISFRGVTPATYNDIWLINSSSTGTFTISSTTDPGTATVLGSIVYGTSIPGLGNSKSMGFTWSQDTTGPYGIGNAWGGTAYKYGNQVTRWGFVRLFALQAYDEFNTNETLSNTGGYKDYLSSYNTAEGFIKYTNSAIYAMSNSKEFLEGTYSNMNDLITADIAGVNLATVAFGQDLINLGRSVDLATISTFGLPSNLLFTLKRNNALTKSVSVALLSSGISTAEYNNILGNVTPVTKEQEIRMYQAFSIILGQDLRDVLVPLNCKTSGLESLSDLLNPLKMFPISYKSLTVPVYNTTTQVTNSKTYYLIYGGTAVNPQLNSETVTSKVGSVVPAGTPVIAEPVVAVVPIPTPQLDSSVQLPVFGQTPSDASFTQGSPYTVVPTGGGGGGKGGDHRNTEAY